ncbi:MAG: hypothetical protein L3J43_03880 [Sulfurovum sp.]|nr:hypothetical protein [Sulfurovum sp.]
MGKCQPVLGLRFDDYSKKALKRIAEKEKFGKLLAGAISLGIFNSIFTKSGPKTAMYNITQTDWELYANAVKSTSIITEAAIRKEMQFAFLHYQSPYNHKLATFWKGLLDGCK